MKKGSGYLQEESSHDKKRALCRPGGVIVLSVGRLRCVLRSKTRTGDLVLTNGKLVTLEKDVPAAEALAARGDKIVAVGTSKEIARYIGPETEVVDLQGRLATPGWIDSHLHFTGVGEGQAVARP